jgi:hypothetical protein
MKLRYLFIAFAVLAANSAASYEMPLTSEPLAYLYFQLSEEPLPLRSMMLAASPGFDDEFERRAFLEEQLEPWSVIVGAVERKDRFAKKVRAEIGEYDFSNHYFPLKGIHEETYLTYSNPPGIQGPGLAMELLNSSEFRYLKMQPDAARALSDRLAGDKSVIVRFVLRPVSAEHKDFSGGRSFSVHRSLGMYAGRAQILHGEDQEELAVIDAATAFEDHSPEERNITQFDGSWLADPWTKPWGSREHFEALVEHYNLENWQGFSRMELASPCVNEFGYAACQRIITQRQRLVARCNSTLESPRLCGRIRGIPYTEAESRR